MSHQQLFFRMLCSEGHVDAHRLRTGRINREEWQGIIKVFGRLSGRRSSSTTRRAWE